MIKIDNDLDAFKVYKTLSGGKLTIEHFFRTTFIEIENRICICHDDQICIEDKEASEVDWKKCNFKGCDKPGKMERIMMKRSLFDCRHDFGVAVFPDGKQCFSCGEDLPLFFDVDDNKLSLIDFLKMSCGSYYLWEVGSKFIFDSVVSPVLVEAASYHLQHRRDFMQKCNHYIRMQFPTVEKCFLCSKITKIRKYKEVFDDGEKDKV